ncbi:MAG: VOC family protein [Corynebacteriales bacterium]|nr:VOC family protein [Mycobacteriales bacterium]
MSTKIFVNLPVKDLDKAKAFYTELGYSFNPQFTDENAACLVISDDIYAMLLVEKFFQSFTKKSIASSDTTEAIIALSADSREDVDTLTEKAIAAGGQVVNEPMDEDFMYSRSFYDLDGHHWEIVYMDMSGAPQS